MTSESPTVYRTQGNGVFLVGKGSNGVVIISVDGSVLGVVGQPHETRRSLSFGFLFDQIVIFLQKSVLLNHLEK